MIVALKTWQKNAVAAQGLQDEVVPDDPSASDSRAMSDILEVEELIEEYTTPANAGPAALTSPEPLAPALA